ncbi:MAG: ornithine cyclodeaminase family protein [Gammaproteobacteria bacterium]|nr:ornithine cyclodeaminase family protein [Gammaproteobacteria bacterium]
MSPESAVMLRHSDVVSLLGLQDCMDAVEEAFRRYAQGSTPAPAMLGMHARDGGFHVKAGMIETSRCYFAAKINANFPLNGKLHGLPLIQGIIVLLDGVTGRPLALMDSAWITIMRTGAATGIAAKHLARKNAKVATICGCGNQGRISLQAINRVRPLTHAYAHDIDQHSAHGFAEEMTAETGVDVEVVEDLAAAVRASDICVTCTPSRKQLIDRAWVSPGTFIAAVGADSEDKQELDPVLLATAKVVADVLEQSATIGDLHHAIEQGLMAMSDVHGELGEVIAGTKASRTSDSEIIVFDSTGMALQDVATAALVYERAVAGGIGLPVNLAR